MPPKSKKARTVNSKILLQEGATTSNSSPQEVHQEVEQGAVDPNINMLYEMIQKTQAKLAEIAKHVKKTKTTDEGLQHKPLPEKNQHEKENNKGEKTLHERASNNGFPEGNTNLQFVTLSDVVALIEKEREKLPKRTRHFVCQPLYSLELLNKPYPKNYEIPTFSLFDGRKRSALEHVTYTWYATLQPASVKTWDDMVEMFCGKFFRVEERVTLHTLHSVKQKARKTTASVKLVERSRVDKRSTPHALVVTSNNDTRNKKKCGKEKEFKEWPAIPCTTEEMHAIIDKWIVDGFLRLLGVSKEPTEDDKKHARFCRYHRYVHHPTSESGSGSQCYTAEAHASRAFLETTNAVTFTDENMEVQYPDHQKPFTLDAVGISRKKIQGISMEVTEFGGAAEPWLHKHKLVPSTYHQCMKGRLNGKPIRIPANATPFDESEAHYVEAAFYDEVTPTEEGLISKVVGTPLPRWEDIKDEPDMDLRKLLEQKRKRKEQREDAPKCMHVQLPDGRIGYRL
uniref:Retrotransposon gag domain-containing protein n=1 Tax=Fagus sylvatica TaxID=28930 RepID=A0A2N9F8A9_FAGSY